jgi:Na+/H+-dicarboxylate symporter
MMMTQANVALVAEDLGVFQAIKRGWQVFWQNLGVFFFLLIAFIILGILAYILMMLSYTPIFFTMFSSIETMTSPEAMMAEMGKFQPLTLVIGTINLLVQIFFRTYFQPFWTLTFFQLTGKDNEDGGGEPLADDNLIAEEAVS